ncbi:hypothetical protein [Ulvibacterium marinum]|uniref:hypothetical protein n=1 Tax=Ulvibacterium marinum TaxID=2419782 RepID=UPI0024952A9C|nr:hypothetical protein [Ulvibacterium marinum]
MQYEINRRCPKCGKITKNSDYCNYCGTLINTNLRRKLEREERERKRQKKEEVEKPDAITAFFEKVRNHSNPIIRVVALAFYSVWVVVLAIGAFLAYIFAYIAA